MENDGGNQLQWDPVKQDFIAQDTFPSLRIQMFMFEGITNTSTFNTYLEYRKNGIQILRATVPAGERINWAAPIARTPIVPGDEITMHFVILSGGGTITMFDDEGVNWQNSTQGEPGGGTEDLEIKLIDYLPEDVLLSTMLGEILKLMNIIIVVDNVNKTVILKQFDSVFETDNPILNYFVGDVDDDYIEGNPGEDSEFMSAESSETMQDWSKFLDTSKKIRTFNYIPGWFRRNIFQYQKTFVWRNDTDAFFDMQNDLLREEGVKIFSMFAATDNSLLSTTIGDQELAGRNPTFELEDPLDMPFLADIINGAGAFVTGTLTTVNLIANQSQHTADIRVGDFIKIITPEGNTANNDGISRQITGISPLANGIQVKVDVAFPLSTGILEPYNRQRLIGGVDFNTGIKLMRMKSKLHSTGFQWVDSLSDVAGQTGIEIRRRAEFTQELTWGSLLENYYKKLLDGLRFPLMIQAWFVFDSTFFHLIPMDRMVYVKSLNGIFWINKIEQYKIGKPVRVELIRMNAIIAVGQSRLPQGGEPLEIELEGLVTK